MLIFIIIILAVIFTTNSIPNSPENQVTYDQLIKRLQNEEVRRLDIYPDADSKGAEVKATLINGDLVVISVPSVDHFMERIEEFEETTQIDTYPIARPNWFVQLLPSCIRTYDLWYSFAAIQAISR